MPSASQHRAKARKNRAFLAGLDAEAHPEWVVAVAFYVAVHRVEELRAALGDGHSGSHTDRNEYVRAMHRAVAPDFLALYNASLLARYDAAAEFFRDFPTADDVRRAVLDGHLAAVDGYVTAAGFPPP